MEAIIRKDISQETEFTFHGDTIKLERCLDYDKHIYLFSRHNSKGRRIGYEIVRGVKTKGEDGNTVYAYPSTSQFGQYGYYITERYSETEIPKYLRKLQDRGKIS